MNIDKCTREELERLTWIHRGVVRNLVEISGSSYNKVRAVLIARGIDYKQIKHVWDNNVKDFVEFIKRGMSLEMAANRCDIPKNVAPDVIEAARHLTFKTKVAKPVVLVDTTPNKELINSFIYRSVHV